MATQRIESSAAKASLARGKKLDLETVQRSIAIDFEGRGPSRPGGVAPKPDYLGIRVGIKGDLQGRIVNDRLSFLARSVRGLSSNVEAEDLSDAIMRVVEIAKKESRTILHFSSHEVDMIEAYATTEAFERCRVFLADGRGLLKRHLNRERPAYFRTREVRLETIANALCPRLLKKQPHSDVGTVLKSIQTTAKRTQRFSKLTANQRSRWLELLEYNFYDLKLLHRTCEVAAQKHS